MAPAERAPDVQAAGHRSGVAAAAAEPEDRLPELRPDADRPELPDETGAAGPFVLAQLLAVERRPDRFRRLLRTWIAKINDAVEAGDVDEVLRWMQVVTDDLEIEDEDLIGSRVDAVEELTAPAVLESLVVALVEHGDGRLAAAALGRLGASAVDRLVEWMTVDDPPVSRRHIVDLLALAGRGDVRSLATHLADARWYVVRNVAIALGRTRRSQAIEPVRSVLDHEDDRVRVEALRSLATLQGERAVPVLLGALTDPSHRVRHAVASLLRASPSRLVVTGLLDVIESGAVGAEQAAGLVELIAERRDDAVVPTLERLAARRMAVGARRSVREAARRALAERAS